MHNIKIFNLKKVRLSKIYRFQVKMIKIRIQSRKIHKIIINSKQKNLFLKEIKVSLISQYKKVKSLQVNRYDLKDNKVVIILEK